MKKTTTKATAAKPAAKSAPEVKAAPAKKSAAPVVKVTPAKKSAAPVVKAAPSAKKAPAVKKVAAPAADRVKVPEVVKVAEVIQVAAVPLPEVHATTIVAAIDVGFGNTLTLRGDGPGLTWDRGIPLECSADDLWTITLPETTRPIMCKFLINDEVWCTGEDYTVLPGSSVVFSPSF